MTVDFEASANLINHLPKIGKGEVHSSILCGSTTKPYKISPFPRRSPALDVAIAQNEARNAQVKLWTKRGVCSADVHGWVTAFNTDTSVLIRR